MVDVVAVFEGSADVANCNCFIWLINSAQA